MSVSFRIKAAMEGSSWIRRMFEEGRELKAKLGPEKVCDFTLGNPDLEPPPRFKEALLAAARDSRPGLHRYMANAGLPETRQALAEHLGRVHQLDFTADDLVLTVGAAGALNIIFKAILDPGDEVVVLAPYFVEYLTYADNHGGVARVVETDEDFQLDLNRLEKALTPKTRAVIINSPNNPTGQVYEAAVLNELGRLLAHHAGRHGRPVYLVADEPYRRIVYEGLEVPSIFAAYPDTLLATSFSKDLSIPGERLGYAAVSPRADGTGRTCRRPGPGQPHPGFRQRPGPDAAGGGRPDRGQCRYRPLRPAPGPFLSGAGGGRLRIFSAQGRLLSLPQGAGGR